MELLQSNTKFYEEKIEKFSRRIELDHHKNDIYSSKQNIIIYQIVIMPFTQIIKQEFSYNSQF